MPDQSLRERVFAFLNTAVDENGSTDLLTHAPEAVALDLTTADGPLAGEDVDLVTVASHVIEWQDARKAGRDV